MYLNNVEFIDAIKKYYDDDEPEVDASNNDVDASNNKVDISANEPKVYNKVELIIKDVSRNPVKSTRRKTIPVFLKDTYEVDEFFETIH